MSSDKNILGSYCASNKDLSKVFAFAFNKVLLKRRVQLMIVIGILGALGTLMMLLEELIRNTIVMLIFTLIILLFFLFDLLIKRKKFLSITNTKIEIEFYELFLTFQSTSDKGQSKIKVMYNEINKIIEEGEFLLIGTNNPQVSLIPIVKNLVKSDNLEELMTIIKANEKEGKSNGRKNSL